MSRLIWPRGTLHIENDTIVPAPQAVRSPNGSSRIYLLVHGFNNTPEVAEESYAAVRERVRESIGLHLSQRIWEFYWPGYEEPLGGVLRQFRVPRLINSGYTGAVYAKQVPKAIKFGEKLGKYLLQLRAETHATEIVLIGHSLGCRLILEALAYMVGKAPESQVPAILLMAAAVPVAKVQPGGTLRAGAEFAQRRIAIFSHRDFVLWGFFPPGQLLARDGGPLPQAVGFRGAPEGCWTGTHRVKLFHGEYWTDRATTPNILGLFGKTTQRDLPSSEIVPRKLPTPPSLPEQKARQRRIGA